MSRVINSYYTPVLLVTSEVILILLLLTIDPAGFDSCEAQASSGPQIGQFAAILSIGSFVAIIGLRHLHWSPARSALAAIGIAALPVFLVISSGTC